MDDTKIREVYDNWILDSSITAHEKAFRDKAINDIEADIMLGFYAGYRTAERLAKIEVLEEVFNDVKNWSFHSGLAHENACASIENRIAQLKTGN